MTPRPFRTLCRAACLAALILSPVAAGASPGAAPVPAAVAEIAATLEAQGYTQVRVTERIFGGYVVEGRKGADFAMIALLDDGRTLDHTELFRDADADGVFEQAETTGPAAQAALRSLVTATLAKPAGTTTTTRTALSGQTDIAGFNQQVTTLFAPRGMKVEATERLGSGGMMVQDTTQRRDLDADGVQRRGSVTTQTRSMAEFGSLNLSAVTALPGGPQGSFAPLTISAGDAAANAALASGIRSTVTASTPDATALRASILSTAPSADAIRAGITPPTAPTPPTPPAAP